MKTIFLQDDEELIDIRKDAVFKAVFARETLESREALSRLVSALIGREISIISILYNEPAVDSLTDRQIRYDINCRARDGELINVEMCFNPRPFEPLRLEYYATRLYSGQDIRGLNSGYNKLKQAYQIAIISNLSFFEDNEFFHSFSYYDELRRVSLKGRSRIITLELTKLKSIVQKPVEDMSLHERWAVYLEYLTDKSKRSKINEILNCDRGIAMANEELYRVSRDEIERARIMREEKTELDYISYMTYEREEGRNEGRDEGREEGRAEGHVEGRKVEREYVLQLLTQGLSTDEIKQRLEQAD